MSFILPWQRVYPELSSLERQEQLDGIRRVRRLTIEFPLTDAEDILKCTLSSTIFTLICQTALKETVDYVRRNNLTYADSRRLIEAICQRTVVGVVEKTIAPDVNGREAGVCVGAAHFSEKPASVGKEVKTGSRRKGGRNEGK